MGSRSDNPAPEAGGPDPRPPATRGGVLTQLGLPDAVPVLFTASQPRRIVDDAPAGLADAVETGRLAAADYLVLVERERVAMRGADPEALSDGWWWTGVVDEFDMV